jgi:hypothetical protein
MTDDELDKVNEARRRKGLPPLSRSQASSAAASAPNRHDAEFDINWFLINLVMSTDEPKTNPTSDPSPGYSPPDISSSSTSDSGSSVPSGSSSSDGGS